VKRSKDLVGTARFRISADGVGVVAHAGVGMLRELSDLTGLSAGVSGVLADTYRGPWLHDPGRVFGAACRGDLHRSAVCGAAR
jgi:hypothetical protein